MPPRRTGPPAFPLLPGAPLPVVSTPTQLMPGSTKSITRQIGFISRTPGSHPLSWDPGTIPTAIRNWLGLAQEERWWLYSMTNAATGHAASGRNRGWRKAIRYALTENPVFETQRKFDDSMFHLVGSNGPDDAVSEGKTKSRKPKQRPRLT